MFHLQVIFAHTAVAQMLEAMSHVFYTRAQQRETQETMSSSPENRRLYNHAIEEFLRLCPLFGIAFRSIARLVFGVIMIREARRPRLRERRFAAQPER